MIKDKGKFSYFRRPITNTTPLKDVSITEAADMIKHDDQLRITTETFRKNPDSKTKTQVFDYVTFGGTFKTRCETGLIQTSGYICLDFDKVADLPTLKIGITADQDFQPVLAFTSPSGNGLKVVYAIDETSGSFTYIYTVISDAMARKFGVTADKAPKNPATACFLGHDPNCYFNADAPVVVVAPEPPKINMQAPSILGHATDLDKVKKAIEQLEEKRIDIVGSHEKMVNIGYSLASLGEDGRELFHRVCAIDGHYADRARMDPKFDDFLQKSRGEVTIGSFFHACKEAGLELKVKGISKPTIALSANAVEKYLSGKYVMRYNDVTGRVQLQDG